MKARMADCGHDINVVLYIVISISVLGFKLLNQLHGGQICQNQKWYEDYHKWNGQNGGHEWIGIEFPLRYSD